MKNTAKRIVLTATLLGSITGIASHAEAGCGSGHSGGGFGMGIGIIQSHLRSRSSSYRPTPAVQRNHTPAYQPATTYHPSPSHQTISTYPTPVQPMASTSFASANLQNVSVQQTAPFQPTVSVQQSVSAQQINGTQPTSTFTQRSVAQPTTPVQQSNAKSNVSLAASPQATEASALEMLASFDSGRSDQVADASVEAASMSIPQFSPNESAQPAVKSAAYVGTWSVTLPGNQSVTLVLNTDQSFTWTATKESKSSSFSGQYVIANNRLTLVRSGDLQKMEGDWTATETGFKFTVGAATAGGLSFTRS